MTPIADFSIFYYSGQDIQVEAAVNDLLAQFKVKNQGFLYNSDAKCWELKASILAIQYETLERSMKELMKSMSRTSLDIKPIF
jgi:hypothetical protein